MHIDLKPLAAADVAMVAHWLSLPHARAGWEQAAGLSDIAALPDSAHDRGFVIVADGRPAGFIQAYNCYAQPDPVRIEKDPPETWGFNVVVGDVALLRRGVATAAIDALAALLPRLCNCTRFIIELRSANVAGIGLLAKSDFQTVAWIDDDPAGSSQIMVRDLSVGRP